MNEGNLEIERPPVWENPFPPANRDAVFDWYRDNGAKDHTYKNVALSVNGPDYAPTDVDIRSQIAVGVPIKVPVVASPMDTVCDGTTAIAIGKYGGVGVIHPSFEPEDQKKEAARVWRAMGGLIDDPKTATVGESTGEVIERYKQKNFENIPVIGDTGVFKGLLTSRELKLGKTNPSRRVDDLMIDVERLIIANPNTDIEEAFKIMTDNNITTLPLTDGDGRLVGLYLYSDVERVIQHRRDPNSVLANIDDDGRLITGIAVTSRAEDALERIELCYRYLHFALIDSSRGDLKFVPEALREIKAAYPDLPMIAGNISHGQAAINLAFAGADGIRVGQTPGAICITGQKTGAGIGQASAVYWANRALKEVDGGRFSHIPIIADGGVTHPGDISKAIGLGASAIMVGKMVAATDESPAEKVIGKDNQKNAKYRGMGSRDAMLDSDAARKRYLAGSDEGDVDLIFTQGETVLIPAVGPLRPVMFDFAEALRHGLSMSNAPDVETHRRIAQFVIKSPEGTSEAGIHGVKEIV